MGKARAHQDKLARVLAAVEEIRKERAISGKPLKKGVSPWKSREIECSSEFLRIATIERRRWEPYGLALAQALSPKLRREDDESLMLRPVQAWILYELWALGFAIGIVRVGGGKSLISFLAPYVVKALRPLLIVPGELLEKTERHLRKDRYNWQIPGFIRVESYEKLAHKKNQMLLYEYMPDLVMFDEASKLKDVTTAVAKIVGYYLKDCDRGFTEVLVGQKMVRRELHGAVRPKRLFLSGTLTNDSIYNYIHILRWCMPEAMVPLPWGRGEFDEWACCLDVEVGDLQRVKPGALLELCNEEEKELAKTNELKAARRAFRRRLIETPGIVSTHEPFLGASLHISPLVVQPPGEVYSAMHDIRTKWKTPDGWEIQDAHVVALRVKQAALGFFQRINPPPPQGYVESYKEWARSCRQVVMNNRRRINSEGQLIDAIEQNGLYPELRDILADWMHWKNTFDVQYETIWIHDYAICFAAQWMKEHPSGIVWTRSPDFGKRLSEVTGVSFYHNNSLDAQGRFVENHPHHTPMICSVSAVGYGKNLQHGWCDNLLMGSISNGEVYEQVMGRTHRDEQFSDCVLFELFLPCVEFLRAFWTAVETAEFAEDMESARKLLYADVTVPTFAELAEKPLWKEGTLG